jgi:hypothetical protein
MAKKQLPEIDTLRQLFRFDVETGKLYWRERTPSMFNKNIADSNLVCARWNTKNANKECGCVIKTGYVAVRINDKKFYAHKIIWALFKSGVYGNELDHINGNRQDNRIANLREVTRAQNNWNASNRKDNKSGVRGVSFNIRDGIWTSCITVNKKRIDLGRHKSFEKAVAARQRAEIEYYGEYARKSQ